MNYILKIYGEKDLKRLYSYVYDLKWEFNNKNFNEYNPYLDDVYLKTTDAIVLIIIDKKVNYTYPISYDFLYKKYQDKNVKKISYDEFYDLIKSEYFKNNINK